MGSTFVSLGKAADRPGFWMNDGWLEVWLMLLALHVRDPIPPLDANDLAAQSIRDQWLAAARIGASGCVPHDMEEAASTPTGRTIILEALASLTATLKRAPAELSPEVFNLMGMTGDFTEPIPTDRLLEIAGAFDDLLAGRVASKAGSPGAWPGTGAYKGGG